MDKNIYIVDLIKVTKWPNRVIKSVDLGKGYFLYQSEGSFDDLNKKEVEYKIIGSGMINKNLFYLNQKEIKDLCTKLFSIELRDL